MTTHIAAQLAAYETDLEPIAICLERFERGDPMPGLTLGDLDEDLDDVVSVNVHALGESFPVAAAHRAAELRARIHRLRRSTK